MYTLHYRSINSILKAVILAIAVLLTVGSDAFADEPTLIVEIDVKPGNPHNIISVRSNGLVDVAILGSSEFNVADIDVATLAFGPESAPPDPRSEIEFLDVNDDSYEDLVSYYRQRNTGISKEDSETCLTGTLNDGTDFMGCDGINTAGGGPPSIFINSSPEITKLDENYEDNDGQTILHLDVFFKDKNGDAEKLEWDVDVVSGDPDSVFVGSNVISASPDDQKNGAVKLVDLKCRIGDETTHLRIGVNILDGEGNRSNQVNFDLICSGYSTPPIITGTQLIFDGTADQTIWKQKVSFFDPNGDASIVDWEIVEIINNPDDREFSTFDGVVLWDQEQQKYGVEIVGTWTCAEGDHESALKVQIVIEDFNGNQSDPEIFIIDC